MVRNEFPLQKARWECGTRILAAPLGEAIWFQRQGAAESIRDVWQEGAPGHGFKFDQRYKEKLAVSLGELTPKVRSTSEKHTNYSAILPLPATL